ncbi:hypothetical protein GN956_G14067 [Arapaima gigas]
MVLRGHWWATFGSRIRITDVRTCHCRTLAPEAWRSTSLPKSTFLCSEEPRPTDCETHNPCVATIWDGHFSALHTHGRSGQ